MTAWADLPLNEKHRDELIASAISPEVAKERGYESITIKNVVMKVGFRESQANVPGWMAPNYNVAGKLADYTFKPDSPRIKDGNPVKYEQPAKHAPILDVPKRAHSWVMDPAQSLFITEGIKKADAGASAELGCVSIAGVWNWKSDDVRAAFDLIPLKGRAVYLTFDSDWRRNSKVKQAMFRLAKALRQYGAIVHFIDLPEPNPGIKAGLDDYFATGKNKLDLLRHATEVTGDEPEMPADDDSPTGPYAVRDGCIAYRKRERDGDVWIPLCNFSAEIVEQVIADNGVEEHGSIALRGQLANGKPLAETEVSFGRFASLDWIIPSWGTGAVINAGMGAKDRLREAIQRLSPDVPISRVYTHPGWRKIDGEWAFLNAAGYIGPIGHIFSTPIRVRLQGQAARLCLPVPPTGDERTAAITTALSILDVAPDRLSSLVLAAPFTAPLMEIHPVDTGEFLVGPTGTLKSELNALSMRFGGSDFGRTMPPGSYLDTANALEKLGFDFKDFPFWVDDYAPTGSSYDVAKLRGVAERLVRAIGNQTGRGRLNQQLEERAKYRPRGIMVSSGEDVPNMQSGLSRVIVAEVKPGDVDLQKLAELQAEPARSQLSASYAAYVQWLAPKIDTLKATIAAEHLALRAQMTGAHLRTPDATANFALGWKMWLRFTVDVGALAQVEADAVWQRALAGLKAAGAAQAEHQESLKPTVRFIELLTSVIARGDAHVATITGDAPADFAAWGWIRDGYGEHENYVSRGKCVGWLEGDALYLDLTSAYAAAQHLAGQDDRLAVREKTLAKRLDEDGFLKTTEKEHGRLFVRKTIVGQRRKVYHLDAYIVSGKSDQSDQSAQSGAKTDETPSENVTNRTENVTSEIQNVTNSDVASRSNGHIGHIGQISSTPISTHEQNGHSSNGKACKWCGRPLSANWQSAWCGAQCKAASERERVAR
jgi:Domain of unknown function (DUF3854)